MPPYPRTQSIAVVGAGVSGLVAAHLLHRRARVTLFEAGAHLGGHVNTVDVVDGDRTLAIDTGFIVYNEPNYPAFSALLAELGVSTQASDMSFSFSSLTTGLEYRGSNLNTLLAQRRNLLRPSFARMIADVPRFNRDARRLLTNGDLSLSLGEFLGRGRYSQPFVDNYLIPLGASIWSADPSLFEEFPAVALARFFERHGLITLGRRPQWRTVTGGARQYVRAITDPLGERVRTNCAVSRIERDNGGVTLYVRGTRTGERFDRVVIATHADAALAMLDEPSGAERAVLGAFRFQRNRATLHTDARLLPLRARARASWNYRQRSRSQRLPVLTYYANRLQQLDAERDYCITLNADDAIDPSQILASFDYSHPVFDESALRAQRRHGDIDGVRRTHYVGAYWGYGFHEDGVQSARRVAERLLLDSVTADVVSAR